MRNLKNFKEIEKLTERRSLARKKMQEIAQELFDFAKENAIELAGDCWEYKYSNAYSGCYNIARGIKNNSYYDDDDNIIIFNDGEVVEPRLMNETKRYFIKHGADYGCENPLICNTGQMKDWILKQIRNIKEAENFEESFLKEIEKSLSN